MSADQGEIKKKARLISAQLSIGEEAMEGDFPSIQADRTEDTLREAVQRLSSPTKKIQEVYLWFSDDNSNELFKAVGDGDLEEAYDHLSKRSEATGKWNAKRDFVLFLTQLLFSKKAEKKHLKKSLDLWKELISSEAAWRYFDLYYNNIDDLNTDESTYLGLRKWADQTVSDIYSQLSEKWDDPEYTKLYTKTFGKIGAHAHKNILAPRTKEIGDAVESLMSIKWHEKSPSKENLADIKKGISAVQDALNALMKADLYEDPNVVTLRDKASDAIRGVALDLNNKYSDYERSAQLLGIAEAISGTQSTKARNQGDRTQIEENRSQQKFLVPILELLDKGKFIEAVHYVEKEIEANKKDQKIVKMLDEQLTGVMSRYITETRASAMEKINKGDFSGASHMFTNLREYIVPHLDRYDLVREKVDEIVADIDERTKVINRTSFDQLTTERDELVKNLFESLGETNSAAVFMCLLDCAYYVPLGHFLQKLSAKNSNVSTLSTIGWWTIWFYGAGLLLLIPAWIWGSQDVVYAKE